MRVLLAEDDRMIGESVSAGLRDHHYAVDWVKNGRAAEDALFAQRYDLLLLDLGLPEQDGLEVLRRIRGKQNQTPVLILTARDDLDSRLAGLDGGADDYIIKPFEMAELLARIRAVLRRRHGQAAPAYGNGVIALDESSSCAVVAGKKDTVELSRREFAVLKALLSQPGKIYSRADLEDKVYAWGEEVESNAIDFLIHGLRKKIGKEHIKNVRGVGWLVAKEGGGSV